MDIDRVLEQMVKFGASDLHMQEKFKPALRIDGALRRLDVEPTTAEDMAAAIEKILTEKQHSRFLNENEGDGSYQIEGLGRFRINAYRALDLQNLAIRYIPLEIPKLDTLSLPAKIAEIALAKRGLVLVTGVTGSGKSTSLAAMLRHINENVRSKIITLEDPVEFLHEEQLCSISQREVGIDSDSYSIGLKQVFRQNPDVILLGEVRDGEVMSEALAGAETGHMVFTTLHTADARHTITRVLSFYPPHDHAAVREILSGVLVATISMRLLPKKGGGRIPAVELMVNTALIADIIAEEGRLHELPQLIYDGKSQYGMQTFDQCILQQYQDGFIDYEVAKINSSNPSEFDLAIQGITGGGADDGK
ncbi:type IV pilus twitching motility protein PilT [Candidatus Zixiibacteriota bacterium]